VRPASYAGAFLMILYYFPHNAFPQVSHGFIVEEHLIYAAAFMLVALMPAAQKFGLGALLRKSPLARVPGIKSVIGVI